MSIFLLKLLSNMRKFLIKIRHQTEYIKFLSIYSGKKKFTTFFLYLLCIYYYMAIASGTFLRGRLFGIKKIANYPNGPRELYIIVTIIITIATLPVLVICVSPKGVPWELGLLLPLVKSRRGACSPPL